MRPALPPSSPRSSLTSATSSSLAPTSPPHLASHTHAEHHLRRRLLRRHDCDPASRRLHPLRPDPRPPAPVRPRAPLAAQGVRVRELREPRGRSRRRRQHALELAPRAEQPRAGPQGQQGQAAEGRQVGREQQAQCVLVLSWPSRGDEQSRSSCLGYELTSIRCPSPPLSPSPRSSPRAVWASEDWIAEHGTHSLQEAQMGTPFAQELAAGADETAQQGEAQ